MKYTCPECQNVFEPSKEEVWSKTGKSNRARGQSHERAIAKKLSKWWDPTGKVQFKRTPQSGGSALKDGFDMAGDLACNDPSFPFHIECKNYKTLKGLHQAILTDKAPFYDWIQQAEKDCPTHKVPLVIFALCGKQYCMARYNSFMNKHVRTIVLPDVVVDGYSNIDKLMIWSLDSMLKMQPKIFNKDVFDDNHS